MIFTPLFFHNLFFGLRGTHTHTHGWRYVGEASDQGSDWSIALRERTPVCRQYDYAAIKLFALHIAYVPGVGSDKQQSTYSVFSSPWLGLLLNIYYIVN